MYDSGSGRVVDGADGAVDRLGDHVVGKHVALLH